MNSRASFRAICGSPNLTLRKKPLQPANVQASELRVALFSANSNSVRDGANQALTRLVEYLLRQGVHGRVYSPTVEKPAFPPTGDLVDVPAIPIPGRSEYRLPVALPARVRRDLAKFNPNIVHVSSPDIVGHRAVSWARRHQVAAVASVHTRFDTYGLKHRVLVIGDGPARPWFEGQLPDAIFIGQQTGGDLARALASTDVFLNPSITEAFGNVTLEAMACALPVIAAEATGATNLVRQGVTGTLVDGTEPDEFADALAAYARDPELRRRHGEAGFEIAQKMDWDTINSAVIRAYKHAIVKRQRLARMIGR